MNGKKAAFLFVGFVVLVVIAVVVTFQIFFATFEPKNPEDADVIKAIQQEEN